MEGALTIVTFQEPWYKIVARGIHNRIQFTTIFFIQVHDTGFLRLQVSYSC